MSLWLMNKCLHLQNHCLVNPNCCHYSSKEIPRHQSRQKGSRKNLLQVNKPVYLSNHCLPGIQLAPPSIEQYTPPPYVPAKTNPKELTSNEYTLLFIRPLLTCLQLAPSSVERYTPALVVPAKMWQGESTANDKNLNPLPDLIQLAPLSDEEYSPPKICPFFTKMWPDEFVAIQVA